MKIIVFIANALIQLVAAAVGFLMLLIGLNGFSERQAEPGLLLYIILAVVSALGLGAASVFTAQRLAAKTSLGKFGASAISVLGLAVIGVAILMIGFFAAILLAEALRK